jgi:hypothetical protein
MQPDFHAEVARETARQVRQLQAVTAAQAMPALCFLHGAHAPRRAVGRQREDIVDRASNVRKAILGSQLKNVQARRGVTARRAR